MGKIIQFLIIFFLFLIPVKDTDFGWHLKCGEQIINTGTLCRVNHFTILLDGYIWNFPSHLYQVLVYFLYSDLGFLGLTLFYGLSAALVFGLYLKIIDGEWWFKLILLVSGAAFSWTVFGLGFRSQILSLYFFIVLLSLIKLGEKNIKYLYFIPVLSLFWVNSHPGFFLAPLVLAILLADKLLLKKKFKVVAIILLISLSATVLNPYGLAVYWEVFKHTQVSLNALIAEWVQPEFWQVLVVLGLTTVLIPGLLKQTKLQLFKICLLLIMAFFALEARRNLPLFVLTGLYIICDKEFIKNYLQRLQKVPSKLALGSIFALLFYLVATNFPNLFFNEQSYCLNASVKMPCRAVDFLTTQKAGNIFNAYEWGGYLIWKLPDFKIFVDGRMPSWNTPEGKSPYTIYLETIQTKPGWEETLMKYQTDYLLIGNGAFMDLEIKFNQTKYGWQELYRDDLAVVYSRV